MVFFFSLLCLGLNWPPHVDRVVSAGLICGRESCWSAGGWMVKCFNFRLWRFKVTRLWILWFCYVLKHFEPTIIIVLPTFWYNILLALKGPRRMLIKIPKIDDDDFINVINRHILFFFKSTFINFTKLLLVTFLYAIQLFIIQKYSDPAYICP